MTATIDANVMGMGTVGASTSNRVLRTPAMI